MMTLAPKPCPTIETSAPPTYTIQQVACRHTSLVRVQTCTRSSYTVKQCTRRRRSSHAVHTRLRRNERLAIERLQQTDCNRDCQEPLLQKGSKTHAQRALYAKNGRNRNERDERATPAGLPPSVENAAEREETLKALAGKQCWHHFSVAPQAVPTQRTHAGRVQ
jgi:hypothetical protein